MLRRGNRQYFVCDISPNARAALLSYDKDSGAMSVTFSG
jgi:hypothetical protein